MTKEETKKTIDWLKEYVNRLKDREDYDAISENVRNLENALRELEEKFDAL